jgi:hypothetical protein
LGELTSGTNSSTFGASFINNTGSAIGSLAIFYSGEQWRVGTATSDQITFEYSLDATSLTSGTWTGVSSLNFAGIINGTGAGQLDGNSSLNQSDKTGTIATSIATGSTFWIRWTSADAGGTDHGLAVDDFKLTPTAAVVPLPQTASMGMAVFAVLGLGTVIRKRMRGIAGDAQLA